jgi:hypothetical protein
MYKTLETLNAKEITGNETSVKHGAFVFCVRRLRGDSFNVTKHNPGSDQILASRQRMTFAEVLDFIKKQ